MKKRIIFLFTVIFCFIAACSWSIAPKDDTTMISINDISIGDKNYIHIRELFEQLDFTVKWINSEKAVLIYKEENFIKIKTDDDYFILNGELIKFSSKPVIYMNKLYVTMDFLNNIFNRVEYDKTKDLLTFKSLDIIKKSANLPSVENKEKLYKLLEYSQQTYMIDKKTNDILIERNATDENLQFEANIQKSEYSETNVQVKGVDEGDIVKTDGAFIYTLSNNFLYIVNSEREDFRIVNTLKFDNYNPQEFYIKDDKLITIGYYYGLDLTKKQNGIEFKVYANYSNSLKIQVYDIADKSKANLIRTVELDGYYLSSRIIDNYLYLAANKNIYHLEGELRPFFKDSIDDTRVNIDYESIKYFPESIYNNYLITLGLDLNTLDSSKIDINAYLGNGNNMYVSKENMYISQEKFRYNIYNFDDVFDHNLTSMVYKFNLEDGKVIYTTKTDVPGTILNQFSMDEHNGYFRIATTKDESWRISEAQSTSNVYVFDKNLILTGKTEDLAPGEKIYSVRFMGDKVYVVTFRQIDPFYVIDLKEPNSPKVLGYLKIPGYSSYLHPYDDNHIIGIGMDTIDNNGRVINGGVKISMFDVSNYNNPIELDKIVIGERGSYTEVSNNHKSLLFSKEKNILSLPIYVSSYDEKTYRNKFETQAAFVLSINENYKLMLRGNISHLDDEDAYNNYIKRIIYIGDNIYTVSDNMIKISDFNTVKSINALNLNSMN